MLPLLYEHFRNEGVTSEMFLLDWMLSIFTKVLLCYFSLFVLCFGREWLFLLPAHSHS